MGIFENIGGTITNIAAETGQKANDLKELTRLSAAASDLEKRISKTYLEIGQAYYEKHKDDAQAEEGERIHQINEARAELQGYQDRIMQLKGIKKCAKCGSAVPFDAFFCPVCGHDTRQDAASAGEGAANGMRICPNCGKQVAVNNAFCIFCGEKLPQVETDTCGEAVDAQKEIRVCPKCGTQIPDDSRFCFNCGADLEQ